MDAGFAAWARDEVGRLRAEADQLEAVLNRYLASLGAASHNKTTSASTLVSTAVSQSRAEAMLSAAPRQRVGRNEPLSEAFEKAGESGLTLDQLEAIARDVGLNANRSALRSFCWNEKNKGRLISSGPGHFVSARFAGLRPDAPRRTNEAAGSLFQGEKPAASVPSTPNDAERRGEVAHDNMTT
jgi:hypothetical protein